MNQQKRERVVIRACMPIGPGGWTSAQALPHRLSTPVVPLERPDVPRSQRPPTVAFQEHLLPAFLQAEQPFTERSFAKWLSMLTHVPPNWLNAFLADPRIRHARVFIARRVNDRTFEDATDAPLLGLPAPGMRHRAPQTRAMRVAYRLNVSPAIGDHRVMLERPADMTYVTRRLSVCWWQYDEEGLLRFGNQPLQLERALFDDSPEALLPFSMTRTTFAVLIERPVGAS